MPNNFSSLVDSDVANQLEKALDRGALFLTPNTRLASYLRDLLDNIMLERQKLGQGVWQSPELLPFDAWTTAQWTAAMLSGKTAPRLMLTKGQDLLYWEQALDQSTIAQTLMSPAAAAAQAQQGYQLLKQGLVDIDKYAFEFSSAVDSRAFYDWIKHYEALIESGTHIALVDAQSQLLSLNNDGSADNRIVVMVGFQAPTPLQKAIVENYAGSGNIESIHLNVGCKRIQFKGCNDFNQELKAAAQWSKDLQDKNPNARIAVVIQNLAQNRMLVERNFLETFEPTSVRSAMPFLQTGFNMSAGIPLSESSVIKIGLSVIDAISRPLSIEQWSALLNSPYIGDDQSDVLIRRKLIAKMHDAGEREYTLSQVSRLLSWRSGNKKSSTNDEADKQAPSESASSNAGLAGGIEAAAQYFISWQSGRGKSQSKKNVPSQWLPVFRKILAFFLWPGSRTLNSDEYQQLTRFESQCESFSSFDAVVGQVSLSTAAQLFSRHCQQQVFHRETVHLPGAPKHVQVLGGLEASGQTFDHIWLMGMSERQWPAMPQAHPLIPRSLQLEYSMPSSSVEREFEYAKQLTTGYLSSASEVVASYPLSVDDIACEISPLVDGLAKDLAEHFKVNFIHDTHSQNDHVASSIGKDIADLDGQESVEAIADHYGKPLTSNAGNDSDDQVLVGGSAMLKDYNVNPLKTYIKWRLGARPLGEVVLGVSALERGNAIHAALEVIWQSLGGSAALQDCTPEQISQLVSDSADTALDDVFARRFAPLSVRLRMLEKHRLQNTLESWLKLEANRPGFIIESLERALVFSIGGQTLRLRIDRIDRLDDGQFILIDYKSGATQPSGWLDEAVTEPQLPLYVCAMDNANQNNDSIDKPPMAIAFARLKAGDLAYEGIGPEEGAALDIQGVKNLAAKRNHDIDDWASLAEHWQQRLTLAINEIAAGNAAVDITRRRVDDPIYEPVMRLRCSETCSSEGELS
jgi:ATP-dependent helicase/nuclease subunit B